MRQRSTKTVKYKLSHREPKAALNTGLMPNCLELENVLEKKVFQ